MSIGGTELIGRKIENGKFTPQILQYEEEIP